MGINLAISNIAWCRESDLEVYEYLQKNDIRGLEIAPTRIFENQPYENLHDAEKFRKFLADNYGLEVCSLQSIWFGKTEKLFGTNDERRILLEYTKKAILFAEAVGAKNMVFGCPKNRNVGEAFDKRVEEDFFKEIAGFAEAHSTVIAMEANPSVYGTNYINTTEKAIELIRRLDVNGFKLNLDLGTIIQNGENLEYIINNIDIVNHVHISEPYLNKVTSRDIHKKLIKALDNANYTGFVSIEMKKQDNLADVFSSINYLKSITVRSTG